MDASPFISVKKILVLLAILYFAGASVCSWNVITHTTGSTNAIEQILLSYSMKNEGALALERYANEHPFMGMFFASPVRHELDLPSHEEAAGALGPDIRDLLKQVRLEARVAAWWSCLLLNLSLLYIVTVIALVRSVLVRPVLFALTAASLFFFLIGIFAPAIIVWTAPTIPMASGNLNFVLQHQVRGIAAIIPFALQHRHSADQGLADVFHHGLPFPCAQPPDCEGAPLHRQVVHGGRLRRRGVPVALRPQGPGGDQVDPLPRPLLLHRLLPLQHDHDGVADALGPCHRRQTR
jgi:hypothetical protein